jgi:hydrogenase expression/formation protein HypE
MEEGFAMDDLERILADMARAAERAGVRIVTGDTKVVARGAADKIFITTSGIGRLIGEPFNSQAIVPGDRIIVSGTIADHGIAVLSAREGMTVSSTIQSDSAPLNHLVKKMIDSGAKIKLLRDPTRGGLATVLNEIAADSGTSIRVNEQTIKVNKDVAAVCDLFGIDPLYVANEGKLMVVVSEEDADTLLAVMKQDELGQDAAIIGHVVEKGHSPVIMTTRIGGERIIPMLTGEQLPRIC